MAMGLSYETLPIFIPFPYIQGDAMAQFCDCQCMEENRNQNNWQHLVYLVYQVDTPPCQRAMQDGAKCIFSYFSHTVVQWPKFGHSTTLNNKGYKAYKRWDLFHDLRSSHPQLDLVEISD